MALTSLCCMLAACSAPTPGIELAGARLRDRSPDGMVIELTLAMRNDHDIALPLRGLSYAVSIDGREVFRGERSPEATLARFGGQTIEIPAAVRFGSDGVAAEDLVGEHEVRVEGTLRYLAPGALAELLFDTGLRRPKARFDRSGIVDLGSEAPARDTSAGSPGEPRSAGMD